MAVTALSAGASDMSGWMLMGLPGAMYATGLSECMDCDRFINRCLCKLFNHCPRLRTYTEVANDSITIQTF